MTGIRPAKTQTEPTLKDLGLEGLREPLPVEGWESRGLATIRLGYSDLAKSKWVSGRKHTGPIHSVVVNPSREGREKLVFIDTVILAVPTEFFRLEKDGQPIPNSPPRPVDSAGVHAAAMGVFGTGGKYTRMKPQILEGREWGDFLGEGRHQCYRISTANLDPHWVFGKAIEVLQGRHTFLGQPIRFVQLDITTNVAGAVNPRSEGWAQGPIGKWVFKDNASQVGHCCKTYRLEGAGWHWDGLVETKVYDKPRHLIECGGADTTIGDNLGHLLDPRLPRNIRLAMLDPRIQAEGFGRIETRFQFGLPSWEGLLDVHFSTFEPLVKTHCSPTSLQECWDNLIPSDHRQTLAIWEDQDRGVLEWDFLRWGNQTSEKGNGLSGEGLEALFQYLHYNAGKWPIEVFHIRIRAGQDGILEAHIVAKGLIKEDPLHLAMLAGLKSPRGKSSRGFVGKDWAEVGLDLPFSTAGVCGRPRRLAIQSESEVQVVLGERGTIQSPKQRERAKVVKGQKDKRALEKLSKLKGQAEKDKVAPVPDWANLRHLSELAEVAKPICTAYRYHRGGRAEGMVAKVGKKWYKATGRLELLFFQAPEPPFGIKVWKVGERWEAEIVPAEQVLGLA